MRQYVTFNTAGNRISMTLFHKIPVRILKFFFSLIITNNLSQLIIYLLFFFFFFFFFFCKQEKIELKKKIEKMCVWRWKCHCVQENFHISTLDGLWFHHAHTSALTSSAVAGETQAGIRTTGPSPLNSTSTSKQPWRSLRLSSRCLCLLLS